MNRALLRVLRLREPDGAYLHRGGRTTDTMWSPYVSKSPYLWEKTEPEPEPEQQKNTGANSHD